MFRRASHCERGPERRLIGVVVSRCWVASLALLSSVGLRATDVVFERDVAPLLAARCVECHGEKRQKGELRLDSAAAIARGGESGAVIVAGRSDVSRLLVAVSWDDRDLRMPPKSRLPDEEIAILRRWVESGAPELAAADRGAVTAASVEPVVASSERFSPEDRAYWFFQPLARSEAPSPDDGDVFGAIDAFLDARLARAGLELAPEADRRTLIRRVTFDLTGMPPAPEEIDAFVADDSPDAWEKLVDRLLASPRYGERQARHWLDLVRYAESNGHRADEFRPNAWRYRDWVIDALGDDETWDRFVLEQLAGDEACPEDSDARVATGFMRLWPYESNQKNVRGQWEDIVNDLADVTGEVFLGMSLRCARCHDHKFDPILQEDYYRLRAFVATVLPDPSLTIGSRRERDDHARRLAPWIDATVAIRDEIAAIEAKHWAGPAEKSIIRFPEGFQPVLRSRYEDLPPLERQLWLVGHWQVAKEAGEIEKAVAGKDAERRKELLAELAKFDAKKPPPLAPIDAVVDVGPVAPRNVIPGREDRGDIAPGLPTILAPEPARIDVPDTAASSSGRRSTLARWLTSDVNALASRVIVNRIWQRHFGRGIVATPSDFGRQGTPPTHPVLLDWLATEFLARGQSFKDLDRSILASRAYRQASSRALTTRAVEADPANRCFSRMRVQRLSSEQLHDAMLVASGEIDLRAGGPGVEDGATRRAVYLKILRNQPPELLDTFDGPDGFNSCARRNETTTAPQALLLLNGEWTLARARAMAARLLRELPGDAPSRTAARIASAWTIAYARPPRVEELEAARRFVETQSTVSIARQGAAAAGDGSSAELEAFVDLCHALVNSNEFLHVD